MRKEELVEHLKREGISERVAKVFLKVPREEFVGEENRRYAYLDTALPIGHGQTISQPYTIARMLELLDLRGGEKVLEVGTGSGYTAALIYELARGPVYSIEYIPELAIRAKRTLERLGYYGEGKVMVFVGDGGEGLPEHAPFSRIIVHAAVPEVPPPLVEQLEEGGVLVAPVGPLHEQELRKYVKREGKLVLEERVPGFVFVPLRGKYGFP